MTTLMGRRHNKMGVLTTVQRLQPKPWQRQVNTVACAGKPAVTRTPLFSSLGVATTTSCDAIVVGLFPSTPQVMLQRLGVSFRRRSGTRRSVTFNQPEVPSRAERANRRAILKEKEGQQKTGGQESLHDDAGDSEANSVDAAFDEALEVVDQDVDDQEEQPVNDNNPQPATTLGSAQDQPPGDDDANMVVVPPAKPAARDSSGAQSPNLLGPGPLEATGQSGYDSDKTETDDLLQRKRIHDATDARQRKSIHDAADALISVSKELEADLQPTTDNVGNAQEHESYFV